ncbi:glycosyltransferase [Polynucleobacter tropicus]|uniref:Glycosyltransferase n=1 Tax=Polynucleobacter tropicus TaxID=1743174 RepID=A0A6M9PW24_9BURK|nr:glycosyltransferase [Polynucleobacter tropicus]QKM64052.1 glycosyltransferase [Polynucleobacter tropicus]
MAPFLYFKKNIYSICNEYDVVVSEANLRYLDRNLLILWPFRKFKWVAWGIGVSASYKNKFHKNRGLDRVRAFLFNRAEALIFYSNYPIELYAKLGVSRDKLFVAHNTVDISSGEHDPIEKRKIIFVGTLYKEKNIFSLLHAYKKYVSCSASPLPLSIIGDGEEFFEVERWIIENKLDGLVGLEGAIYDPSGLALHFREAYACISPDQAGLSVLTSMGYGVPFITKRDAFTGGEIFNIEHMKNGVLYGEDDELVSIFNEIEGNRDVFIELGERALKHYRSSRTMDQMCESIERAINFAARKSS